MLSGFNLNSRALAVVCYVLFLIFTTEFVWASPDKSLNPRNITIPNAHIDILAGFQVNGLVQKRVLLCASVDAVINAEDIERKQVRILCASSVREGRIFSAKFHCQGKRRLMLLAAELFEYFPCAAVSDDYLI